MRRINKQQAYRLIIENRDVVFFVEYKKINGAYRRLKGMYGADRFKSGGQMRYNPIEQGYLPVWDLNKRDWRVINLNGMTKLRIKGDDYIIS